MTDLTAITDALRADRAVLLPTETVWGLAARADSANGIAEIYRLKGRDDGKPLAVCVSGLRAAERLAEFSAGARDLAQRHWPGALTLVLPVRGAASLQPQTRDGAAQTIGLRCPDIFWREALCDVPLALTSANPSGSPAATTQAEARAHFPQTPLLHETQTRPPAAPTTVVRVVGARVEVLRQGDLTIEATPS